MYIKKYTAPDKACSNGPLPVRCCLANFIVPVYMSFNIAIVGPARSRQGTGPYVARVFHQLGANIHAVVSSSLQSAEKTATSLQKDYGIDCLAFASMEEMLGGTSIDIVAICSPATAHYQYLHAAAEAGCHIFCEKPLWWPRKGVKTTTDVQRVTSDTIRLVQCCNRKNITLQLNTQWAFTLPGYYELYPQQNQPTQAMETFSMWLSPQSTGKDMIIDAVPHLLSMLYALLGAGRIHDIHYSCPTRSPDQELHIKFNYLHAMGDCRVALFLSRTDAVPKPAAYAIDNQRIDRHVDLPNYLISLRSPNKQLPIADPLVRSIKNFIGSIHSRSTSDEMALIEGMEHLLQIYQTVNLNQDYGKNSF